MKSVSEDIDKRILSDKITGILPEMISADTRVLAEVAFDKLCFAWIEGGQLKGLHTFTLFNIPDHATLRSAFNHIVHSNSLYKSALNKITICSKYWEFTLVPAPFYKVDGIADVLNMVFPGIEPYLPGADMIEENAVLVYKKPTPWGDFAHARHSVSAFVQKLQLTEAGKENAVWALLSAGQMVLVHINDNKLQFCNAFTPQSQQDYLYYVLLVYNQLRLNATNIPLTLCGEIEKNAPVIEGIGRYVKNIQFIPYAPGIHIPDELAGHYHYSILSVAECAL
jgi:hypothetical protein